MGEITKQRRWKTSWWFVGILLPIVSGLAVEWLIGVPVFSTLTSWITAIYSGLVYKATVPVWVLIVLPVSLPAIIVVIIWLSSKFSPNSDQAKNYLENPIFGIKWEQEKIGYQTRIEPVCPQCDHDLKATTDSYRYHQPIDKLLCLGCGFEKKLDMSFSDFYERVLLHIKREMRKDGKKMIIS